MDPRTSYLLEGPFCFAALIGYRVAAARGLLERISSSIHA